MLIGGEGLRNDIIKVKHSYDDIKVVGDIGRKFRTQFDKKKLTIANQSSDPDSNSSSAKIRLLSGGGRSKMTS